MYLEKERNWKDLRSRENRGSHTNAWCHGGSGILLSRLSLLELEGFQEDKRVARDIERGTACLMRWKKDSSICLCHGLAGKYMILCEAAIALGRDELRKESAKIRRRILELERVPVQEYYNASLMAGISGAALALCGADAELLY